jgi:hypothetical protein
VDRLQLLDELQGGPQREYSFSVVAGPGYPDCVRSGGEVSGHNPKGFSLLSALFSGIAGWRAASRELPPTTSWPSGPRATG